MPEFTIVTLVDEEGDEFPFARKGSYLKSPEEDRWLKDWALNEARHLADAGRMQPVGNLEVKEIK